jgi:hypothetical protein
MDHIEKLEATSNQKGRNPDRVQVRSSPMESPPHPKLRHRSQWVVGVTDALAGAKTLVESTIPRKRGHEGVEGNRFVRSIAMQLPCMQYCSDRPVTEQAALS